VFLLWDGSLQHAVHQQYQLLATESAPISKAAALLTFACCALAVALQKPQLGGVTAEHSTARHSRAQQGTGLHSSAQQALPMTVTNLANGAGRPHYI
jgi:hypothetical protein